jgi:Sulfotransferase domain
MRRLPAERIPTLPAPLRAAARTTRWTLGHATSRLRVLPDFLVLGAQKAGTTALYAYLRWHPSVLGPSWKEVSYFDRHYLRGAAWYRGQFPTSAHLWLTRHRTGQAAVGEASPSYLFHPLAPDRTARLLPRARLIVLLRDPVERAYSHYQHEVSLGREPLSFEQALEQEEPRLAGELARLTSDPAHFSRPWWDHTYQARGRYVDQVERWLAVFPRERLHVMISEEMLAQPADAYGSVLTFLGLRRHALVDFPRIFERDYPPMATATRRRLAATFAEPNTRLELLLGRRLDWTG